MGAWKMTLVSKGAIFHFHDYGRKGNILKHDIFFFGVVAGQQVSQD